MQYLEIINAWLVALSYVAMVVSALFNNNRLTIAFFMLGSVSYAIHLVYNGLMKGELDTRGARNRELTGFRARLHAAFYLLVIGVIVTAVMVRILGE